MPKQSHDSPSLLLHPVGQAICTFVQTDAIMFEDCSIVSFIPKNANEMEDGMEITARMEAYRDYLRLRGFSQNTVDSYVWVAAFFERTYGAVARETLNRYRDWLVVTFKMRTANQRVQAMNCYLGYLGKPDLKLRSVSVQQKTYLDTSIGDEEYKRLASYLRENGYARDYNAVRLMVTTGVRVSELLRMEVSHMQAGYLDLYSKGKARRVFIPTASASEALRWAEAEGRGSGLLFLNRYGNPITARGLAQQLKIRAAECGIDSCLVHPHAFRHLFARHFLQAGGDVAFLADLLGHSSVETTRVYLRRTASEQHKELERLVTW